MAKRKAGSIAVPFLTTIFIGLLLLGGAAIFIYNHYIKKEDEISEPKPRDVKIVSYEDSHTVLMILNEPEQKCSSTFMLMRSIPKDRRVVLLGIPSNTVAVVDGEQQSLKGAFERGGGNAAVSFTESIMGCDIEKYITFDSPTFRSVCDQFGCVTYPVDVEIATMRSDGSPQSLTSEQMETFMTYSLFTGGEVERAFRSAHMISYMINGADGAYIYDTLDAIFSDVVNGAESNVTSVDYKEYKDGIKQMFMQKKQYNDTIAVAIQIDGTNADGDFIPSKSLIDQLREQYFEQEEK